MRYATFYYDLLRDHVSNLEVHQDKEKALKHFNSESPRYFELKIKYRATKLPASYGYPLRKYYGVSARTFKKMFGVSIDEAVEIAQSSKQNLEKAVRKIQDRM